MAEHPIQGLMKTAMESIREMVDVNTIVGDPVETQDASVIMPVSRVSFGFAAGGAEYGTARSRRSAQADKADGASDRDTTHALPFGGGSGAGVSIRPVGFLVVGQGRVRLLPVDGRALYDRLIDLAPELIHEIEAAVRGNGGGGYDRDRSAVATPLDARPTGRRVRTRPEG